MECELCLCNIWRIFAVDIHLRSFWGREGWERRSGVTMQALHVLFNVWCLRGHFKGYVTKIIKYE
jgi:hypothetical protein